MPGKFRFSRFQIAVHILAWLPLAWLVWAYTSGRLTVNPIQDATQFTGKGALILLVLSLAATPLHTLTGFKPALAVRRLLGLYAFLYASIHFMIFIWLDYGLDLELLREAILEKRFVLVGLTALVILFLLSVTSFDWWKKRLRKNWKRLHRLVYLAGVLVIIHSAWAKKGDLLRLQGDQLQPFAFGLLVAVLLAMRIPIVKRQILALRARWSRRRALRPVPPTPVSEEEGA